MKYLPIILVLLLNYCWLISADLPVNCTYEDIKGYWMFSETDPIRNRHEKCDNVKDFTKTYQIRLDFPNLATDQFGNVGTWTIIYNQGFEVIINYRKYFAFSAFEKHGTKVISKCHLATPGWSHDVLGNNWACFKGEKVQSWEKPHLLADPLLHTKVHEVKPLLLEQVDTSTESTKKLVEQINAQPDSWKATVYPDIVQKNKQELIAMAGGPSSRIVSRPKPTKPSNEIVELAKRLPESFDWRDVNGINYVSPVRNQGSCGSCYIFASMALLESRIRIATNNTEQPVFSTQYVNDCSQYSQGCDGGFPYLIAGKFAQDHGVVQESCYPYVGHNTECRPHFNTTKCLKRTYTFDYQYVGGYYGACNEEAMRVELVQNGPIAVGFEVYKDFSTYKNGVYFHHKNISEGNHLLKFEPFELTNHAVLIVGYGVENKPNGKKYWIVKNSWGTQWGIDGYFYIERGTDECGIESLALKATPIPNSC